MTIAAKISSTEIQSQLTTGYVNRFFEAVLVYSPGTEYSPGVTDDTTFLADEVVSGFGGYQRQVISYTSGDIAGYADYGMALARKAAVFAQDGSADAITFSHICLVRGVGNILTMNTPSVTPTNAIDGTYENLPALASASGLGASLNLTVSGGGTVFTVTPSNAGYGYVVGETLTIQNAVLEAAGVCGPSDGVLAASVASVTTGTNTMYSVSKTDGEISITDGNTAIVYFDIKHFGFYN